MHEHLVNMLRVQVNLENMKRDLPQSTTPLRPIPDASFPAV
jgi:hypothetical protein